MIGYVYDVLQYTLHIKENMQKYCFIIYLSMNTWT